MIEQLYLNPLYWAAVATLVVVASLLTRSRVLGFRFVLILLLAQYVAHSMIAFGPTSPIAWFCTASYILFVVASLPVVQRRVGGRFRGRLPPLPPHVTSGFDGFWFQVSRLFLIGYWTARLIAYPFSTGDLDLAARLAAQQQARPIFLLGLVTLPAIAACMAVWLRRGRRLTWVDLLTILLTIVALAGSDSKATILPVLLAFFGTVEMTGRRLREFKAFLIPGAALVVLAVGRLLIFFPGQDVFGVLRLMLFRIAADTDSLEYLAVIGRNPQDFPYAGAGGLAPYLTKPFGYVYPYSPGTWLFGERYGDFSGYGPNSGPVMDYFGNVGWFGLGAVLLAAVGFGILRGRSSPQAVAAASVIYLAFVDVTLFDLPVMFWTAVAVVGLLTRLPFVRERADRLGGGRLAVLWKGIDSPLPRLRRRKPGHRAAPARRGKRQLTAPARGAGEPLSASS